jgi:hypothetical protein
VQLKKHKNNNKMKKIFIAIFLILFGSNSFGQCGLVSSSKDKETGIITKGGVVSSKDFYSLLIQKRINPTDSLNYFLFLNAASKVMLSDSLLNSKGKFELFLTNGEKIIIDNAKCMNDPLGLGASIGFSVDTDEKTISQIITNPILKIKVFGILETEFAPRKQKQIQKIVNCLVNEQ